MPKYFSYKHDEDVIQYYTAQDKEGNLYHLVTVTCEIAMLGNRSYSFVFDSDWKCILHSNDRPRIDNGSMLDFTGDGYLEKILRFNTVELNGNIHDIVGYDEALQVWRLQGPSPKLLLDVRYKGLVPLEANSPYGYQVRAEFSGNDIRLISHEKNESYVSFSWSQEDEQFIYNEVKNPEIWTIIYPDNSTY